jgi:hypothetical protein
MKRGDPMELLISIVVIILFMAKWGIERTRTKALMYFIVDRGYTPPTEQEMMECIKIVTQKTVEKWIKA